MASSHSTLHRLAVCDRPDEHRVFHAHRAGVSKEAHELAPGAFDPHQPGQTGHDRSDVAAAIQNEPPAEEENADGAEPADRAEAKFGGEFEEEDPALRLEDVLKIRDDLRLHPRQVAVGDPVRGVAQRLDTLSDPLIETPLNRDDDRGLRNDDAEHEHAEPRLAGSNEGHDANQGAELHQRLGNG